MKAECHSVIFGFDPGNLFGWSVFADGGLADSGVVRLSTPDDPPGVKFKTLARFLRSLFEAHIVAPHDTLIGYEDVDVHLFKNKDSLRAYAGFIACIQVAAVEFGVNELRGVNPIHLKQWATGDAKATKQMMILEATLRFGVKPDTDDHADACHIGGYFSEYPCPSLEPCVIKRVEARQKKKAKKSASPPRQVPKTSSPSSSITLPKLSKARKATKSS